MYITSTWFLIKLGAVVHIIELAVFGRVVGDKITVILEHINQRYCSVLQVECRRILVSYRFQFRACNFFLAQLTRLFHFLGRKYGIANTSTTLTISTAVTRIESSQFSKSHMNLTCRGCCYTCQKLQKEISLFICTNTKGMS